ncbi:MAG: ACT domain-containing protein [Clostridia bacterium]|nr:ACT domain-containing protein [Clostridia bacterium]
MRAVISVMGKDQSGIIAKVATALSDAEVNILDISQTILQDVFAMIMLVDLTNCKMNFRDLVECLNAVGREKNVTIHLQKEEVFESMHHI